MNWGNTEAQCVPGRHVQVFVSQPIRSFSPLSRFLEPRSRQVSNSFVFCSSRHILAEAELSLYMKGLKWNLGTSQTIPADTSITCRFDAEHYFDYVLLDYVRFPTFYMRVVRRRGQRESGTTNRARGVSGMLCRSTPNSGCIHHCRFSARVHAGVRRIGRQQGLRYSRAAPDPEEVWKTAQPESDNSTTHTSSLMGDCFRSSANVVSSLSIGSQPSGDDRFDPY
jgi:hypothetical protein